MKTVIMEPLGISQDKLEELEAPLAYQDMEFVHFDRTADIERKKEEIRDADAVILANMPLEAEVIEAAEQLKFIDIAFTGVNHVAVDTAKKKGIVLSNAAGYSTEAVAELGVGMVLSLYRKLRETEARCRKNGDKTGLIGMEIKGKTVGIVGYGAIGRRSGELFHAFGAEILANKKHKTDDIPDYVQICDLETLLKNSDIVLLHCPLNKETEGLIGEAQLGMMKENAVLVNLARGPVVDQDALIRALEDQKIAGACLDVFEKEPPLGEDPIIHAPATLLTPHIGFATQEALDQRADIVFANLDAWMKGRPENLV